MKRFSLLLALAGCLLPAGGGAAEGLAKGQLLVASHELQGPNFAESVVLLLHYDENGAIGLIVNRPTDVPPSATLGELEELNDYDGTLYFGGPVAGFEMRVLLYTDQSLAVALPVFDRVYLAPFDDGLLERLPADSSHMRFYVGYAGWAPGQLEHELQRGSWHIRSATVETVFAEDEDAVWKKLVPPLIYQAANEVGFNVRE